MRADDTITKLTKKVEIWREKLRIFCDLFDVQGVPNPYVVTILVCGWGWHGGPLMG
jgi:hypothetical protein